MQALTLRGLYAITDGPRHDLIDVAQQALAGGARILQYRDKTQDQMRRLTEANALRQLCRRYRARFIVNDDIMLAAAVAADGVHLGQSDPAIESAHHQLGAEAIVGISCYDSIERARSAVASGASYVAFGRFFPSITKPEAPQALPTLLKTSATLAIPRIAIGGITPDNAPALIAAGADMLAVVSALFAAKDVYAAAQRFTKLYPPESLAP